jgi:hypothetical protein
MSKENVLAVAFKFCKARKEAGKPFMPSEGAVHALILVNVLWDEGLLERGSEESKTIVEAFMALENGSALLAKLRGLEDGEQVFGPKGSKATTAIEY